jgi:Fic family protein
VRIEDFRLINGHDNTHYADDEIEFLQQSNWIEGEYGTLTLSNAMHAWDYMRTQLNFRLETILHCHYILMCDIDSSIAGKIRKQDVWIGGCLKPFISENLIRQDLQHLLSRIEKDKLSPKEAHIQFEFIHPFVDGNGRVGRILYNAHRRQLGKQVHIIKESEKNSYYDWFSNQ